MNPIALVLGGAAFTLYFFGVIFGLEPRCNEEGIILALFLCTSIICFAIGSHRGKGN